MASNIAYRETQFVSSQSASLSSLCLLLKRVS